jgi:hypothetical protein
MRSDDTGPRRGEARWFRGYLGTLCWIAAGVGTLVGLTIEILLLYVAADSSPKLIPYAEFLIVPIAVVVALYSAGYWLRHGDGSMTGSSVVRRGIVATIAIGALWATAAGDIAIMNHGTAQGWAISVAAMVMAVAAYAFDKSGYRGWIVTAFIVVAALSPMFPAEAAFDPHRHPFWSESRWWSIALGLLKAAFAGALWWRWGGNRNSAPSSVSTDLSR